eukprot:GEMP01013272.1.p1 GENE.GEMP01013272.1~~GEMP01013272.1.p1  ORF type:complete len:411 (+),score=102.46 GEMP01013272.1:394-1626(+)
MAGRPRLSPGEMWLAKLSTAPVEVQPCHGNQDDMYCVVLANPWYPDRGLGIPHNNHARSYSTAQAMADRLRQSLNITDAFEAIDEITYYHLATDLELRRKLIATGSNDDLAHRPHVHTMHAATASASSTDWPEDAYRDEKVIHCCGASLSDDADIVPPMCDAPASSSSPSASSTSSHHARASPPGTCGAQEQMLGDRRTKERSHVAHDTMENECPICMDAISTNAAVRCLSEPCHYFHNECLGRWISECPNGVPSCPMCRQGIEIDAQVLAEYLRDANVTAADRSRLQYLLDNRLDHWVVLRSAAQDVRLMVDVPLNMCIGAMNGFNNLTEQQNSRLDEGLGVMRAVMRLASEQFEDDGQEYRTHPCLPHTYAVKFLRHSRRGLLEWTRSRLRQTEFEIEYARRSDDDRV